MSTINVEITEQELKNIIRDRFAEILGDIEFSEKDIKILVKSKQNYKSEWEDAHFKATINKNF